MLGFLAACTLIRTVLPFPEITPISSKLRFFEAHRDEIDTVFLGSSRVYQEISPVVFDQVMKESGHPTHAFNLGVNGMFIAEESYVLEQLLPKSTGKLRWVFIELEALSPHFDPNNAGARRISYWHDWTRTHAVFRKIFKVDDSGRAKDPWDVLTGLKAKKKERHDLFVLHFSLFAKTFINLGAARNVAEWFSHRSEPPSATELGQAEDGYHPRSRQLPADKRPAYERALRASDPATDQEQVDWATEDICRRCAEAVRRRGAVPIFIVTPIVAQAQLVFVNAAKPPGALLSFNDFRRYPELFRPGVRIDGSHLTPRGSEAFSRFLAQEFAASLGAGTIK